MLPQVEHRYCYRHLYANWRKKHRNKDLRKQFYAYAKSSNMPDFEANMEEMKKLAPKGFNDILNTHPRHWCRAYFNTDVKCVDNNLIEAFNEKIIEFRDKHINIMLKGISGDE